MELKNKINILKVVLLWLPYILLTTYFIYPDAYSIFHGFRFYTIDDMEQQAKLTPQEPSTFMPDSASFMIAPANSIPSGKQKYRFHQVEYDSAIARFVNTLPDNDYTLARGKNRFEIFCTPCHGDNGNGEGLIVTKPKLAEDEEGMPSPADLTRPYAVAIPIARIFHILSAGQNLMFPVNFKMNETDRLALVYYIRYLQKNNSN